MIALRSPLVMKTGAIKLGMATRIGSGLTYGAPGKKLMRVVEGEDLAGVAGKPRG